MTGNRPAEGSDDRSAKWRVDWECSRAVENKHQNPGLFRQPNWSRPSTTIKSWNAYPNSAQRNHSTGICRKASFTFILLNKIRVVGTGELRNCNIRQIIPRNTCPSLQADENSVSVLTPVQMWKCQVVDNSDLRGGKRDTQR